MKLWPARHVIRTRGNGTRLQPTRRPLVATVHLWHRRYSAEGLAGFVDRPRSADLPGFFGPLITGE